MHLAGELDRLVAVRGAADDGEAAVLVEDRLDQLREVVVVLRDRPRETGVSGTRWSVTDPPVRCGGDPRRPQRPVLCGSGAARSRGTSTSPRAAEAGSPAASSRSSSRRRRMRGAAGARRTRCRSTSRSRATRRAASRASSRPCSRASTSTIAARVDDFRPGRVNAIMHLEGAEPLAPDLSDLERWYDRGLRSVGIVWSRPNAFAEGVPFRFPVVARHRPRADRGGPRPRPRLQPARDPGRRLAPERGRVLGRRARSRTAPLVATHSNAHALCASSRNLTDEQLDAIGRVGRRRRDQLRDALPARGRRHDADDVRSTRSCATSTTSPRRIGVDARRVRLRLRGRRRAGRARRRRPGCRGSSRRCAPRGYDDDVARADHARQLAARARRDVAPVGPLLPARRRRPARDAASTRLDRFAAPGLAVDLGAGTGRDTAELLRRGWRVIAIDREPEAIDRLHRARRARLARASRRASRASRRPSGRRATS